LTVTDQVSRFILMVEALEGTHEAPVFTAFHRLFEERGLPRAIRSDNGTPFASRGLYGLSRLSVWWLRLGIALERITPGKPQQNGRHERMHLTLKQETIRPAAANSLAQQARFDAFLDAFNTERPHEALAMKTPAAVYTASPRALAGLPELAYPFHDHDVVVTRKAPSACTAVPSSSPPSSRASASACARSTPTFGSSASCTTISDTSTWRHDACKPSTPRSARGCHPCDRYEL